MKEMKTLYEPSFEHDACGIGAVVSIDGIKSHGIVDNALSIVEKLEHRAGKDASGETGDGVGILVQISHDFFKKSCSDIIGKLEERDYGIGQFFFPGANSADSVSTGSTSAIITSRSSPVWRAASISILLAKRKPKTVS